MAVSTVVRHHAAERSMHSWGELGDQSQNPQIHDGASAFCLFAAVCDSFPGNFCYPQAPRVASCRIILVVGSER